MRRSPLGKSGPTRFSARSVAGMLVALLVLLSSCIPRWERCAANDFTCDTGMQLLSFAPGSVVMVGGRYQAIEPAFAVSTDDGDTWSFGTLQGSSSTGLTTMNFADGRFLAGTGSANIYETRDSGKTWSLIPTDAGSLTSGVGHADGRYIVQDTFSTGTVRAMPDGGSSWASLGSVGNFPSPSIVSAGGRLYILAQGSPNGLYYHTSPSTWTAMALGGTTPYSLCMDDGMIYVAVNAGTAGAIYAGRAGATSFTALGGTMSLAPGAGNNYMACHGSTFVVPVGNACQVAVSTNAGASWNTVGLGCAVTVSGVTYTGKRYVAATSMGAIYVSDDALTWRQTMAPSSYNWTGIAANQAALYY